ncbi:MAG: dihydroorotase [Bacteroidia bacterium]|nr:dihydroorotase [Bacteroidia bacterium]
MDSILIKNAQVVNEGTIEKLDVYIQDGLIHSIGKSLGNIADHVIDAEGLHLVPGVIDDQVHFREPGLTHKADLTTESRAAVAGGITTFMEMPNTKPQTLTQELLEEKYKRASEVSVANYSFFMGASNDNIEEVLKTDPKTVCGVKIFMGSSTGNMLVDDASVLEGIFSKTPMLVATHCEKEEVIRRNMSAALAKYGEDIPITEHPNIRSREACLLSSSQAVELAKKHGTRLHILHISTADELSLFNNSLPLEQKRITAEVCIHHLWFEDSLYAEKGTHIKWNPAVKTATDRAALRQGLKDGYLDIIATDHAPHTLTEKSNIYTKAPSGGPLVQHALPAMLDLVREGQFTLPFVVDKMSHAPAICFQIEKRGYIREGYFADLVLVDLNSKWKVEKENVRYKCGWSPFEGHQFSSQVRSTIVSGELAYHEGEVVEATRGKRITFSR